MSVQAGRKDILVVGFGAIGSIYSLILQRSNLATVTCVARSNYDAVKANGLHIKSQKYGDIPGWRPDRLCPSVQDAADRPYDFVIVTTKAVPELCKTPDLLRPLLSGNYANEWPRPTFVLIQNGLNVEVDLYKEVERLGWGELRIVSTAVWIAVNCVEQGVVEHSDFDRISIGIYRNDGMYSSVNTPHETTILNEIGSILEAGGSTVKIVPDIHREKFIKNLWNVAFSSVATLTGYRLPSIFRGPPTEAQAKYSPYVCPTTAHLVTSETIPAIRAVLNEMITLGRAMGIDLPDGIAETIIQHTRKLHRVPESFHTPSMLLDSERGQPMEVEVIVGEVVRMGRRWNVSLPRIEMLYALLIVVQNQMLSKLEERSGQS